MVIEKLGLVKEQYAIAVEKMKCGSCEKDIPVGRPYQIKQTIKLLEGEYVVERTIECMSPCSLVLQSLMEAELDSQPVRSSVTFPAAWDDLPLNPTSDEQRVRIVTTRNHIWIASGYTRILEWESGKGKNRYCECSVDQIQKRAFVLDPQNKDSFGVWERSRTSDGIVVRKYKESYRDLRAGFWYLPMAMTEPQVYSRAAVAVVSNGTASGSESASAE